MKRLATLRQINHKRCPRVSLIVPNFNGINLLRECLSSLIKLDYPDYEIIVSDGGSTDGSPEMVKAEFPNVLLVQEKGAGIGRSVNLGAAKATGEIIGFDLNSDEVFESEWLMKLVDVLLSSDKVGVVGGTRLFYGTKNLVDEGGYRIDFLCMGWSNIKVDRRDLPATPEKVDFVGTPLVRRSLFETIGGCDERYHLYFEDSDFCLRVKKGGFKVLWIPDAISYHRRSASINPSSIPFLYIRNTIRFVLIHFSWWKLPFTLAFQLFIMPFIRLSYTSATSVSKLQNSTSRLGFLYTPNLREYLNDNLKAILWNLKNIGETLSTRRAASRILEKSEMSIDFFNRKVNTKQKNLLKFSLEYQQNSLGGFDLILDVGSGDNPLRKANVLCDLYRENIHRGQNVVIDKRPFLFCDVQYLPF